MHIVLVNVDTHKILYSISNLNSYRSLKTNLDFKMTYKKLSLISYVSMSTRKKRRINTNLQAKPCVKKIFEPSLAKL